MRGRVLGTLAGATIATFALSVWWGPEEALRWLGRTTERRPGQTVTHRAGMSYALDVTSLGIADRADNSGNSDAERIEFFENGVPLRRSSSHAEIEGTPGLFSHWGNAVIFSRVDGGPARPEDDYAVRYRALPDRARGAVEKSGYVLLVAAALLAGLTALAFARAGRGRPGTPAERLRPPLPFPVSQWVPSRPLSGIVAEGPVAWRPWRALFGARWGPAACALFAVVSVPLALRAGADRCGWILMTRGVHDHVANTQLGYCCFRGSVPVMEENVHSDRLIAVFSGVRGSERGLTCYAYRGWYSFVCVLFAPALGVLRSMQVVNWLAWALAAWAAYRLTTRLFDDRLAGLLAVLLVSGGIGFLVHIGDYSAHLMAFAVFYLAVTLIHDSGVLTEARPLRVHLGLGAFLAVASLVYTNGPILVAIYVLSALRRNRWLYLAPAVLLAVTARPAWEFLLARQGVVIPNDEGGLLAKGLASWWGEFRDPVAALAQFGRHFLDFISYECPLTALCGVAAWLGLCRRRADLYFGALVLVVPVLAVLPFAFVANARGYLVYGSSIWLFAWLAGALAGWLRRPSQARPALAVAAALVLLAHFAWSTAHLWGHVGPVKTYYQGASFGLNYFRYPSPPVVSLTGLEEVPTLAGGSASLERAGATVTPGKETVDPGRVSAVTAFRRRALFFAYLALLTGFLARRAGVRAASCCALASAVLALAPLSAAASARTLRSLPAYYHFKHNGLRLPPGAALTYRVKLGAAFRDRLARAAEPGDQLRFFLHSQGELRVAVRAGSCPIPVKSVDGCFRVPLDDGAARAALLREGEFTVEAANDTAGTIDVAGWQRPGLGGRELNLTGPATEVRSLPAVEVRDYRADGTEKWAGL